MKVLASVISTVLQSLYVFQLLAFFYVVATEFHDVVFGGAADPKLIAGAISQSLVMLVLGAIVGFVGVAIGWWVVRRKEDSPSWFFFVSRVFAIAWLMFVPIGTIIGIYMLRWKKLK